MTDLNKLGIFRENLKEGYSVSRLFNEAVLREEGRLTKDGALLILTGKYTGRSPLDRFIVRDEETRDTVAFGEINQPLSEEVYEKIKAKVKAYVKDKDFYLVKAKAAADDRYAISLNVVCEDAAQAAFSKQIFIEDEEREEVDADFNLISLPNFKAEGEKDGIHSEAFIIISFKDKLILIGNTKYAGEIKKAVFSIMNYLLPADGVLPMHCSANEGPDGDAALFFGLSGTGKTTLSSDEKRNLIGDDEHGWTDHGIFNIEGGCYAKCIGLERAKEREIFDAIRFGSVLENVVVDDNGQPDYFDGTLTENTRCTYPLEFIAKRNEDGKGNHPKTILFLTADAFGVIPPISKLTKEGAMYHFISGYTSKLAGTERGIKEPVTTFSALFGAPFMPREVQVYADLLGEKIMAHDTTVYLINTGWSGGSYKDAERTPLKYTRLMVEAAISGELTLGEFIHDEIFNVDIPKKVSGIPDEFLFPRRHWKDESAYEEAAKKLAEQFRENFKQFKGVKEEIKQAGPCEAEVLV